MKGRASASPSRERMDANELLHQLMKKVEMARRNQSADSFGARVHHDEEVRKRREEVLRDSQAAALLRTMREREEREALKKRRNEEEHRKREVRERMYQEFEAKRQQVYGSRGSWKADAASEHQEQEEMVQWKRQTVKEIRDGIARSKYDALERLSRAKEEAHAARLRDRKVNTELMTEREAERAGRIQSSVAAVRNLTRTKQDALDAVYERNRAAREQVVALNETLRRRELCDIANQMERLQRELASLS